MWRNASADRHETPKRRREDLGYRNLKPIKPTALPSTSSLVGQGPQAGPAAT
jgi:hypothetical protein